MIYGRQIEINPNRCQASMLDKFSHTARAVFNLMLEIRIRAYEEDGKYLSSIDVSRDYITPYKNDRPEFAWLNEAPREALTYEGRHLDAAFKNFFRGLKTSKKVGFPRFKKRGICQHGFTVQFAKLKGWKVHIPRLGSVRMKERFELPAGVRILSASVYERAGRWFISFQITNEKECPEPGSAEGKVIGVDLGIKELATTFDGKDVKTYKNVRAMARNEKQLKLLQKRLARRKFVVDEHGRKRPSNRRARAKSAVAKRHLRISNIRKDHLHKVTSEIISNASVVVIEDLNVKGMVKNRNLAKAIHDVGWGELRRMLEYKAKWRGVRVVVVDRFYPSSKTCSGCGKVKSHLPLSARTFICGHCGTVVDRDENAARNLHAVGSTVEAGNAGEAHRPASSTLPHPEEKQLVVGCEVQELK